jgi:SAM-dependent methyltransferase
VTRRPTNPSSKISRRNTLAVWTCLALDELGRKVFRFEEPVDIASDDYAEDYFMRKISDSQEFLRRFPPVRGLDVLEIGCGYGGMLVALAERGARPVGIDIDRRRVAFARQRGLRARRSDAESLPFDSQSFDAIVCDEVIEHLADLNLALREAFRVLRPGGRFYAVWGPSWLTYNGPHLIKVLAIPWAHLLFSDQTIVEALMVRKRQGRWPASNLDARVEDFLRMGRVTRKKLRAAAREAGFVLEREETWSPRSVKHAISRIPPFDELLAGELTVVMLRPLGTI